MCKECGGGGICEHGRVRSICEHGRVRSMCKECGGGGICEHGRVRSRCKECDTPMNVPDLGDIDWTQVWRNINGMAEKGEYEPDDSDYGQDPCDDCCCGSCGRRTRWPGEACC